MATAVGNVGAVVTALPMRWLLLVVGAAAAFSSLSGQLLLGDVALGAPLSYLPFVIGYALFAALAVRRRARPVVEIHDRESDAIVGGLILVVALSSVVLVQPALAPQFFLWRFDLLGLWLFVVGAAIVLFGLRRVFQYAWPG